MCCCKKDQSGHTVWSISYISNDLNNLTLCVLMKIRSVGHTVWSIFYISSDLNNLISCVMLKIRSVGAYCMEYFLYF